MRLEIDNYFVEAAELSEQEALEYLALSLYKHQRLSLGNASRLANLSQAEFLDLMEGHGININCTLEDLNEDMETLRSLDLP